MLQLVVGLQRRHDAVALIHPHVIAQVGSRERTAEKLIKTLRELPNKEALALRSEVAVQVAYV